MNKDRALRLRVLRMERGLTQFVVAQRLGISQGKYWQIENGYTTATPKELNELARMLRVSVEELGLAPRAERAS